MKSTVSLQMIVKDEYEQVKRIIEKAFPYFDEINLTVSDKTTANKLSKLAIESPNVKYREWNDNFSDARNANYAMSTTDYTFWVDADDQFNFSVIPELVAMADENQIDAIFLPYNYAFNDQGQVITRHWRERLVRNGRGYTWKGAVHETLISDQNPTTHMVDEPVIHTTSPEKSELSRERNHQILVAELERDGEDTDPRTLHYLGMSLFALGDYEHCIDIMDWYLRVGGSIDDSYRALTIMSEAAYKLDHFDQAMEYAMKCMALKPEDPTGYWLMAQYEADQENWEQALEWCNTAETKKDPEGLSVYDPTSRERAVLIAAQAHFMLGEYNAALKQLRRIPNNEFAKDLMDDFTDEADAETFTKLLGNLRPFFQSDIALWESLSDEMKYDKRLRWLRNIATEPQQWNDKSIVIFCGQGYEEWGPHTLDKGMGGSEEAVVYLSRELARLGYRVTVYGEAKHLDIERGRQAVVWLPWQQFDPRDQFNVFVAWRAPQILEKVNAKVKLADIHDIIPEELVKNYPDVTYLFKSNYHKELYGDVDSRVIGNGIDKEQFNG